MQGSSGLEGGDQQTMSPDENGAITFLLENYCACSLPGVMPGRVMEYGYRRSA